MTEWFETFFDALAHDVWRGLVPDEHSDAEAAFVVAALGLDGQRPGCVLDVPAGDGRIAGRIASAGHRVTAVDLSSVAVERLHELGARLPIVGVHGDMRALDALLGADQSFDGAYCLGNSFGYLDDAGTAAFVAGVAARLRPGGRLVIDYPVAAECVFAHYSTSDEHRSGAVSLAIETTYEPWSSTLVGRMVLQHAGVRAERVVRHRARTCADVVALLDAGGFDVVDLVGGYDGTEFSIGAPTLVVVAARR